MQARMVVAVVRGVLYLALLKLVDQVALGQFALFGLALRDHFPQLIRGICNEPFYRN
jgi:hypothetical protein